MEYEIIYSDRRTLALSVKDGRLIVRAPRRTAKERIERVVASHLDWARKHMEKQRRKAELTSSLTEEQIADLKKRARAVLTAKTEYFSQIMGLKHGRITITSAKTRFGSCNSKGNICYSYRLMLYPEEAIDYVVVHELAHIKHKNHGALFHRTVEKYLPLAKEYRKLLKKRSEA